MNPFRRKSDHEIVDSLRRVERIRRPVGLALIIFGLVVGALSVWGSFRIQGKLLELADTLSDLNGDLRTEIHDTSALRSQLRDSTALMIYVAGLRSGQFLNHGGTLGGLLLGSGVWLRFGGRRARMLIHYFDIATKGQTARSE
jgi:hypothetical protein